MPLRVDYNMLHLLVAKALKFNIIFSYRNIYKTKHFVTATVV